MLESSLQQLKRENKTLKEKLDMTEINVSSFVREMGGMLDQHELSGALSELINEEFQNPLPGDDDEAGDSTGGSIRRSKNQ